MIQGEILQSIVENQNIRTHFLNGEASGLDPVLIYHYLHALEVFCQHVGFIPREHGVQKQLFPITDNLREPCSLRETEIRPSLGFIKLSAFITSAENGNLTASLPQGTSKQLDHWGLASPPNREVPHAYNPGP